jgi:hypothetical protein
MKRLAIAMACLFTIGTLAYAAKVKSLDDYLVGYSTWLLGGNQPDHEGNFIFMPLPSGEDSDGDGVYTGEMDVTLKKNESFVLPIFFFYGETYNNGTPSDDPANHDLVPSADDFKGSDLLVELDGTAIIDSDAQDLADFFVDTQYYKKAIEYDEPSSYGSVSAIWVEGLAFTQSPLSKGEHTLHLRITNDFLADVYGFSGWENTWHIAVT